MAETGPTCEFPNDVISSLPKNVLSQIMECLPLLDAARTSVLSKTWRDIWLSLPKLTFDSRFLEVVLKDKRFETSEIYALVSEVLFYHVGPVTKFEIYIPKLKSPGCLFAPCLSFLSKHGVKEITIQNDHQGRIKLSSYLFACLDLEKLRINRCTLDVPSAFKGFRNLLILELNKIWFVGDSFRRLIDCCPQLESLTLLKWSGSRVISITPPKMKHLILSGIFETFSLCSPQNLISMSITIDEMVENYRMPKLKELIKLLSGSSKLERLYLGGYSCKLLSAGGIVSMLPFKYKCLKALQLSNVKANDENEFRCIVGMIRSSSVIEVLKLSFSSVTPAEYDIDGAGCCSLDHLRTVEVTGVLGFSMELKLIEFLLTYSPALRKFYIERSVRIRADFESKMTRQLMRFPRASTMAEIIYLDPKPSVSSGNTYVHAISWEQ